MNISDKVFVVRTTHEEGDSVEETAEADLMKISWMSRILRLVVRTHLVPVSWDEQSSTLDFRLISKASFLACAVTIVTFGSLLSFLIWGEFFSTMLFSDINFIDKVVLATFPFFVPTLDLYSFLLAHGLTKMSSLSLSKDLPWPSDGSLILVGLLLVVGVSCPAGRESIHAMQRKIDKLVFQFAMDHMAPSSKSMIARPQRPSLALLSQPLHSTTSPGAQSTHWSYVPL